MYYLDAVISHRLNPSYLSPKKKIPGSQIVGIYSHKTIFTYLLAKSAAKVGKSIAATMKDFGTITPAWSVAEIPLESWWFSIPCKVLSAERLRRARGKTFPGAPT